MQIYPLALSIAAPAVVNSVQAAANLATDAGASFAQALANLGGAESADGGDEANAKPSLGEQLQAIAGRLRDWLGGQGVSGPFELNMEVDDAGQERLNVSGMDADKISSLLAQEPAWRKELTQLAANMQSLTGAISASGIALRISEDNSHMSFL